MLAPGFWQKELSQARITANFEFHFKSSEIWPCIIELVGKLASFSTNIRSKTRTNRNMLPRVYQRSLPLICMHLTRLEFWPRLHKATLRLSGNFCKHSLCMRRIFLRAVMDESTERGLKSTGNTMTMRKNLPEHREYLQKFPRNLKLFYATGLCIWFIASVVNGQSNFVIIAFN